LTAASVIHSQGAKIAIVRATLVAASHTVEVTPVVSGTPNAVNIPFGTVSQLNLTDPDSMKITPSGEVLLDDQADGLLVFWPVASPNAPLRVLPLLGTVTVDNTVFAKSRHGVLLVADRDANTIYAVTTPVWPVDAAFSAAAAVPATKTTPAFPAYVGKLLLTSGAVVPVVTNLVSPHGMAFVEFWRDADWDDLGNPAGEANDAVLRLDFDRRLMLQFHGSVVTSDAGLLPYRELEDVLGLTAMASDVLADARTGKNGRHALAGLFRQSIFGRLAGYEDLNDAQRPAP
jgi:hypothetical protein